MPAKFQWNGLMWTTDLTSDARAFEDSLGSIPDFLAMNDPRPAREQFQERYRFGGWRPTKGWRLDGNKLKYPGDPVFTLIACTQLRQETIYLFSSDWVVIVQQDGTFEVSRMD